MTTAGCVYYIESEAENTAYVGSTVHKYLSQRFNQHRYDFRNRERRFYSSCFQVVCDPQATITVLERGHFQDRRALRAREGEMLDDIRADPQNNRRIVNMRNPRR